MRVHNASFEEMAGKFKSGFSRRAFNSVENPGFISDADEYFRRHLINYGSVIGDILAELYFELSIDSSIKQGIVFTFSHTDYEQVKDNGFKVALSAIHSPNNQLVDLGLQCFDSWELHKHVDKLYNISVPQWLDNYRRELIKELSDRSVEIHTETDV